MEYTKKTRIVWDSLNEKLRANGTHTAFYQERQDHLDQMIKDQKTENVEGITNFVSYSPTGLSASIERFWVDQAAAEEHIQFFKDLVNKYGIPETLVSAEVLDYE